MTFYLHRDGAEHGPYNPQQIRVFLTNGSIAANCPARRANGETWHTVTEVLAQHDLDRPAMILKAAPIMKTRSAYAGLRLAIDLAAIFGSLMAIASLGAAYIQEVSVGGFIMLGIIALAVIYSACIVRGLALALLDIADNTRRR